MNKYCMQHWKIIVITSWAKCCAQDSLATSPFRCKDILSLEDRLDSKIRFLFKLDDRITFIRTDAVDITGIQLGLQKRRLKLWLGYAFINAPTRNRIITEKKQGQNPSIPPTTDTIRIHVNLQYGTLLPEYVFVWRKYYELSAALGIGVGVIDVERSIGNKVLVSNQNLFIPIEPALKLAIKPTRWAGLSASIGYRETLSLATSNVNYSGLFYSYGVSIYIGNILEDVWRISKGKRK